MSFEVLGSFNATPEVVKFIQKLPLGVLALRDEEPEGFEDLLVGLDFLEIGYWRTAGQLHSLDPESVAAGRALLFPKLHVPELRNGAAFVFLGRGRAWIYGDHLLVEIGSGDGFGHLGLEEGAGAELYVDHVGLGETEQEVLELDEGLASVLNLAVVPGMKNEFKYLFVFLCRKAMSYVFNGKIYDT